MPNDIGEKVDVSPAIEKVEMSPAIEKVDVSLEIEKDDVVQTIPGKEHGDKEEPVRKENHDEQSEQHEPEDSSVNDVQQQDTEVRRSVRQRVEPDRLTYQTLGNFLTLVMHSLLNGLDQTFTKALDLHPTLKFTTLGTDQMTTI